MNLKLVDQVAWIGRSILKKPIRGVVFNFAGLGGTAALKTAPDPMELEWADGGALVVYPYYSPWAWMNPDTVMFLDDLVETLYEMEHLSPQLPLMLVGGSMGGHGALTYAFHSRHTIARCYTNCPVCDLRHHYGERPDLPRTLHVAYGSYGDIGAKLIAHSPIHQVHRLPRIPYLLVSGTRDDRVAKTAHADAFYQKMTAAGHQITHIEEEGMGHCGPMGFATFRRAIAFIRDGLMDT